MTESSETKVCPACAEVIKAKALVCPHCRYSQKLLSWWNPNIFGAAYGILILVVLVAFGAFMENIFGPKHDFSPSRDRVEILESRFSINRRGAETNTFLTVVGVVTNGGDSNWKDVGLEARFFDAGGNLIDVVSRTGDYGGTAVLKHNEAAFKIEGRAARPESEYNACKVYVRWAKQADAWP